MMDVISKGWLYGGPTLFLIVAMSIVALGVGAERWATLFVARRRMVEGTERILQHLREGNRTMALAVNSTLPPHPGSKLFALLISERATTPGEIKRMQARIIRGSKIRVWILGTIGATAPFVGLFGTVIGIMAAFRQISIEGGGGFDVVSGGISEALIATAAGILVGVEAMVLFNYLQVQASAYAAELREAAEELAEASAAAPSAAATLPAAVAKG